MKIELHCDFRRGYQVSVGKCLDSFLLCNSSFLDELFALEDILFFEWKFKYNLSYSKTFKIFFRIKKRRKMIQNYSFLWRKAVKFFARILRIFSQFCEFGRPKSEAKRKRTLLDFLRSEAKRIRFAFAFFRNKANSQCEFEALVTW